jgi:glycosyltransferase involved in cell wall biosynthesis
MTSRPLHILVLVDRDWSHPQAGGTGANLRAHVNYFVEWGHRVTVMAGSYPGAIPVERDGPVTVYRNGGRKGVFHHTIARLLLGRRVRDADVVLEIINGITFLTPLWLRVPHVQYVHHVHREQYIEEMGLAGRMAAFVAETAPLRWLYRRGRFVTVSEATARQLMELGIPREAIEVNYHGPEPDEYGPGIGATEPTLIYLGRLKRYKRIEMLLDVLDETPDAHLDIVGTGEYRPVLEAEIAARGLGDRVRFHGFVDHERKVELLQRAWALVTASAAEGWGLTTLEAAACATPSVAFGIGGLAEAIEHERTGLLARDPADMVVQTRRILADPELRERLGANALRRAQSLGWRHTVGRTLAVLEEQLEAGRGRRRAPAAPMPEVVAPVVADAGLGRGRNGAAQPAGLARSVRPDDETPEAGPVAGRDIDPYPDQGRYAGEKGA